jgi:hypothetical protein
MLRQLTAIGFLTIVVCGAEAAPPARAFVADEHTLLLCHFDQTLDADDAVGSPVASGHAALTGEDDGRFWRAVLLQRSFARGPNGIRLPFAPLQFDTAHNLDARQGTLEFWVRPTYQPARTESFGALFYLVECRQGEGFGLLLTDTMKGYRGIQFFEIKGKQWNLSGNCSSWRAEDWHHVAAVWAGRHRALYLDGQLAGQAESPNETLPLGQTLLLGGLRGSVWPAQAALDELRISDVARYGTRGTTPLPPVPPLLERSPARPEIGWRNDSPRPGEVKVRETVHERPGQLAVHEVTLRNAGEGPQLVEAWLDVPFAPKGDWWCWDGRSLCRGPARRALQLEARGTAFEGTFPLLAAFDGRAGVAVGLAPSEWRSWFAVHAEAGVLRFRTRVALAAGQTEVVQFVSFPFAPGFGYRAAIQAYQDAFPQWFRPASGIDSRVLTGCLTGTANAAGAYDQVAAPVFSPAEIARRSRNRWEWCGAPFKYAGDILVRPELWDLYPIPEGKAPPDFRARTPDAFLKSRRERFSAMERWGIAPLFYVINWVDKKLSDRYADALIKADDVLDRRGVQLGPPFVHSYSTDVRAFWAETTLGKTTRQDMQRLEEDLPISGFAHDEANGGANYRGAALWRSPGRAYDEHGSFINEGIGAAWLLDQVHALRRGELRLAAAANDAGCPYAIAFRVDNSIWEGVAEEAPVQQADMERMRLLHGSKPRCLYHGNRSMRLGEQVDFEHRSRAELRSICRQVWDQALLFCLHQGYVPSPDLSFGYARAAKLSRVLADCAAAGWQPVCAMRASKPLWLARYGHGKDTWLTILNPREQAVTADVEIEQSWLASPDVSLVFANGDGSDTAQRHAAGLTRLSLTVPGLGAVLLQPVAELPRAVPLEVTARQQWWADRGQVTLEARPLPATVRWLPRRGYRMVANGEYRSTLFQSAEEALLAFAFMDAAIVLPRSASAAQRRAAWRIQEYFRFWTAMEQKARAPLKLTVTTEEAPRDGATIVLASAAESRIVLKAGTNPVLLLEAPDSELAVTVEALMDVLDKRFPVVGDWACHLAGDKGQISDPLTQKLLERAGYPGPPLK